MVLQLVHKINALRIIKKALKLDEKNIPSLVRRIEGFFSERGGCVISVTGAPGCGKSTLARRAKEEGLFSIPAEKLFIIDDLRGPEGERYSRRQLKTVIRQAGDKVVLLFDYRAAVYLKNADICIILGLEEEQRLKNLKVRSHRGYRRYRGRFYSISPIPLRWNPQNVYVCRNPGIVTGASKR